MNPNADDTPAPSVCSHCNQEHYVLYSMKHNGEAERSFCTSCVLKLNPCAYCPVCFSVYDRKTKKTPGLDDANPSCKVTCLYCKAIPHPTCVPPRPMNLVPCYLCPRCCDSGHLSVDPIKPKNIDERSEKLVQAACEIAGNTYLEFAEIQGVRIGTMLSEYREENTGVKTIERKRKSPFPVELGECSRAVAKHENAQGLMEEVGESDDPAAVEDENAKKSKAEVGPSDK